MCALWFFTGKLFTRVVNAGESKKTCSGSGLFYSILKFGWKLIHCCQDCFSPWGSVIHPPTHSHHCQSAPLNSKTISIGTGNTLWVDVLKITTCPCRVGALDKGGGG